MVFLLPLEQYQHFDHLLTDFQSHILMSSTLLSMEFDASVSIIFVSTVISFLYVGTWSLFSILIVSGSVNETNFWRELWTVLDISVGKAEKEIETFVGRV